MQVLDLDKPLTKIKTTPGNVPEAEPLREEITLWMIAEVTEEDAEKAKKLHSELIEVLSITENNKDAFKIIEKIQNTDTEPKDGEPWTLRALMLHILYTQKWPNRKEGILETPKDFARGASLSNKVIEANGELTLSTKEGELLERYCYEANTPLALAHKLLEAVKEE